MIDLTPPKLWLPQRPAIVRPGKLGDQLAPFGAVIPGLVPVVRPSRVPVLSYINNGSSNADQTTYAIGDRDFGPEPGPVLAIYAIFGSGGAQVLNALTVGGVTGTVHVTALQGGLTVGIASAVLPAGGLHAASVSFTGAKQRMALSVWALRHFQSATPIDTDSFNATSGGGSLTLDIATNGVAVFGATRNSSSQFSSWTGATERNDFAVESSLTASGADKTASGAALAGDVVSVASASNALVMAGVSWR